MTPEQEAEMTRDLAEIEAEEQKKLHLNCIDKQKVEQAIERVWKKTETLAVAYNSLEVHAAKRALIDAVLIELGLE